MKRARIESDARPWGQVVEFDPVSRSTDQPNGWKRSTLTNHPGVPNLPNNAIAIPAHDGPNAHPRLVDRSLHATLGRHLRGMFDDVARAPVPDKFLELLQNLESKEKEQP